MINKLAIQSAVVLCSLFVAQSAFADTIVKQLDKTPLSNLIADRPITFDNYTNDTSQMNRTQSSDKNVEQSKQNYFYGGIDAGTNAIVDIATRTRSNSNGVQLTGKVGYSMNGPRLEIESSFGSLESGGAAFNNNTINAYYDFQTGSIRPYIGIGGGLILAWDNRSSASRGIGQSKLGVSFETAPGNNFYVELRGVQLIDVNSVGIASFNVGSSFKF